MLYLLFCFGLRACTSHRGFNGTACEINIDDECPSAPCQNGGTCLNRANAFECVCVLEYQGPLCADIAASISATFTYTGAPESWSPPWQMEAIRVRAWGAGGGGGEIGPGRLVSGGAGAFVDVNIPVDTAATNLVYQVRVGGGGQSTRHLIYAYNGGGPASLGYTEEQTYAGGGGGGTDIRIYPYGTYDRVAVAGGGGGGASRYNSPQADGLVYDPQRGGRGGCLVGEDGIDVFTGLKFNRSGAGGGQLKGGFRGVKECVAPLYNPSGGVGGLAYGGSGIGAAISSTMFAGGGGGGGLYGGGGGMLFWNGICPGGSGGGGSSLFHGSSGGYCEMGSSLSGRDPAVPNRAAVIYVPGVGVGGDTALVAASKTGGHGQLTISYCPQGYTLRVKADGRRDDLTCYAYSTDCQSMPCQNGGTCVPGFDSFRCVCSAGYSGPQCQTNIDDCTSEPCQNGGTCIDDVNAYQCACTIEFSGTHCDAVVDACASEPCQNDATCEVTGEGAIFCSCPLGWTGDFCETAV